jgi:ribonuclease PH
VIPLAWSITSVLAAIAAVHIEREGWMDLVNLAENNPESAVVINYMRSSPRRSQLRRAR